MVTCPACDHVRVMDLMTGKEVDSPAFQHEEYQPFRMCHGESLSAPGDEYAYRIPHPYTKVKVLSSQDKHHIS